ncbi:PREDICTED: serine/threonine-protein phosphatase with EF-hands 1 [Tinamus guttatus]|uniref:serine/threonine-protein phosphatase with EF-hands 1 n=1 Tax=Tinamus guttatus TaxID=94827 RepID=UPI00052F33AE|nr:PREDICTED: serine/threonine-protein phosphatase with EF-hands 1 [Tinamus guttatus]
MEARSEVSVSRVFQAVDASSWLHEGCWERPFLALLPQHQLASVTLPVQGPGLLSIQNSRICQKPLYKIQYVVLRGKLNNNGKMSPISGYRAKEPEHKCQETNDSVLRAALLIQRWYRATMARIEMRRRYSLNIFQSIEYADEQAQLQLSNFFTFMMDHFSQPGADSKDSRDLEMTESSFSLAEFERRIDVPDSYYGPRLKFPLTAADANALLDAFKNEELLHARYVLQLLHETRRVLKEMPNITYLSTSYSKEITVCGDLHGKLDDLLMIFYKNGLPSEKNPYVFNGDFVDRGNHSMEILIILFAFLLIYPNDLHLNRGNHEDYVMNVRYGFTREVLRKYRVHGKVILYLLEDVFSWLPLATVVDSKVLILHGGISDTTDLDFLNLFERSKVRSLMRPPKSIMDMRLQVKEKAPSSAHHKHSARQGSSDKRKDQSSPGADSSGAAARDAPRSPGLRAEAAEPQEDSSGDPTPKEWQQTLDILWSDPRNQRGCIPNKLRGGGCYFGPDITAKLFERYNLKLLIRSHECKQDGYEIVHGGKVITIFSASNYYEDGSNRGAYIKLNPDLSPRFIQYQVSRNTCRQNLQERINTVEEAAIKALREKIYANKTELMEAFINKDLTGSGKLSVSDWAEAMESVLQLELPWRTLRPQLARSSADGRIEYTSCFYDLKIEKPIEEVQPSLVETVCKYRKDLEMIFNFIDKDQSGLISLEEFHHTWKLFCAHVGVETDDEAIDKLANTIDYNKDGYIDFSEFLGAFHVVHRLDRRVSE